MRWLRQRHARRPASDWRVRALRERYVSGEIEIEDFEQGLDDLVVGGATTLRTADAILKDLMVKDAARKAGECPS